MKLKGSFSIEEASAVCTGRVSKCAGTATLVRAAHHTTQHA